MAIFKKPSVIGKTKRSTDELIDNAIAQQTDWMERRRRFARRFLKTLNIFARPNPKKEEPENLQQSEENNTRRRSGKQCCRYRRRRWCRRDDSTGRSCKTAYHCGHHA